MSFLFNPLRIKRAIASPWRSIACQLQDARYLEVFARRLCVSS